MGIPLNQAGLPRHVAVIMDGNGRWGVQHGLSRSQGHRRGLEAMRAIVRAASELGVAYLTLYSFSADNWMRPKREVSFLLALLRRFVRQDLAQLHCQNVRIKIIGEKEGLRGWLVAALEHAENLTRHNQGLQLQIAFNYGARQEITRAVRKIAEKIRDGVVTLDAINPDFLSDHLDTAGIPEPDLLIRTGGEQRLSNYLLWQCAYTEFIFVETLWPDFSREMFEQALCAYTRRDRRFGAVKT